MIGSNLVYILNVLVSCNIVDRVSLVIDKDVSEQDQYDKRRLINYNSLR